MLADQFNTKNMTLQYIQRQQKPFQRLNQGKEYVNMGEHKLCKYSQKSRA